MQQIHSSGNTVADTVVDIRCPIQTYSSRQIHSSEYKPLLIHSSKYTAVANPDTQGRYGRVTEIHQQIYSSGYSGGRIRYLVAYTQLQIYSSGYMVANSDT
jgi:hypothetical protein